MKTLVDNSLISYGRSLLYSGFKAAKHDPASVSTFDTFYTVDPDLYIADADFLTKAVIKNIAERPQMRVCVLQRNNFPEHPNFKMFKETFGDLYDWILDAGHADIFVYLKSEYKAKYKSDIVSIEDRPIAGIENINPADSVTCRLYSSQMIKHNRYCGYAPEGIRKDIYASAKLCYAQGDNVYNAILCGCRPIDINADITEELNKKINLKDKQAEVLSKSTNFHAVASILQNFGFDKESKIVLDKLKEML
jgi:hypothetical protein